MYDNNPLIIQILHELGFKEAEAHLASLRDRRTVLSSNKDEVEKVLRLIPEGVTRDKIAKRIETLNKKLEKIDKDLGMAETAIQKLLKGE